MHITVAIPTVRAKTLRFAVESVLKQTHSDWELLLVGQGEDAELKEIGRMLEDSDHRIRFLHIPNMGISFARNAAIAAAKGEVLAFTDDDCEAEPAWLAAIETAFTEDPELGMLGGALIAPHKNTLLAVCPEVIPVEAVYDPAVDKKAPAGFDFTGGNFALRLSTARRIGDFDVCMGTGSIFWSAEDLDYKFRLESAGVRMRSTPKVVVRHTYGHRYGLKALYRHRKGYAVGQGALAAKLTMSGDRRGELWVDMVLRECLDYARAGRFDRVANALLRYHFVKHAYFDCMKNHHLDPATGLFAIPPGGASLRRS